MPKTAQQLRSEILQRLRGLETHYWGKAILAERINSPQTRLKNGRSINPALTGARYGRPTINGVRQMRLLIASFTLWFLAGYLFNYIATPHEICERVQSADTCNYLLR